VTSRIAIVGMNNPLSSRPEHALWPEPVGCTGWRLWQMTAARTGATQADYLRAFHRYNLVAGRNWNQHDARINWRDVMESFLTEEFDRIVLLGSAVRRCTGLLLPPVHVSRPLVCIPHPSGLNRWYNDRRNTEIVELVMEELYWEATRD